MDNLYIYLIVALLPISALMLMVQVNPYQALVIRGVLGAIAVLSYLILGAADVALTEALMGTFLGVALYVIAIRSCFVMRLGVLTAEDATDDNSDFASIIKQLKKTINQVHLRLELVFHADEKLLEKALNNREIHGYLLSNNGGNNYMLNMRIKKLFNIINNNKFSSNLTVKYQPIVNNFNDGKSLEVINK